MSFDVGPVDFAAAAVASAITTTTTDITVNTINKLIILPACENAENHDL